MAALGWLGMAGVLVAWGVTELWSRVTSTEVLAVFEDADHPTFTDAEFEFDARMDRIHRLIDANHEAARVARFEADALAEIERLTSGDAA